MKIKITEEQYNTLLNEGFFNRVGANLYSTVKNFGLKPKNNDKENIINDNYKELQIDVKVINNKIKSFIDDINKLFPVRNEDVDEYLYFLAKFMVFNQIYLNLDDKNYVKIPKAKSYTDSESTKKDDDKLKYMASKVRDYIVKTVNYLNNKFKNKMDMGGNIDGFKFIGTENYIYFLGEVLNENKIKGKLDSDRFGYTTRYFFKPVEKTKNQETPNQTQPTQETPNQTQPTQTKTNPKQDKGFQTKQTKTNYPGRTEELKQKMQSKLNPNPYYGK